MSVTVTPKAQELLLMTAMTGLAAYTGAKLHLYKNNITPTVNTVLADFTEADYTGYAAQTVTWSPAYFDLARQAVSNGGLKLFTQTGATGNDIFGCYLTDTAGTGLLWSSRLDDAPFSLVVNGDTLPIAVVMGLLSGIITVVPGP